MSTTQQATIKRADEIEYESLDAADGISKGVLIGPEDGASNLAIRRFVFEADSAVPKHTNEIEHEQYVLEGEYIVGIGEDEYTVSAGDSIHIPAGTVHWYRNESDSTVAFICAVPTGEDSIELVE